MFRMVFNRLTSAPSIKRARAKLQEEEPKYISEGSII
jgi:hypothetical protein